MFYCYYNNNSNSQNQYINNYMWLIVIIIQYIAMDNCTNILRCLSVEQQKHIEKIQYAVNFNEGENIFKKGATALCHQWQKKVQS